MSSWGAWGGGDSGARGTSNLFPATVPTWLFVGDSLTATSAIDWVTQMTPRVPGGITVTNVAASGATVSVILTQWRTFAVSATPQRVFVLGGINDIRTGATASSTFALLAILYAEAKARGTAVIAMPTLPFGNNVAWTAGRQTELMSLRSSITASADVSRVIDLYTPMGEPGQPEKLAAIYDSGDGLHPNSVGAAQMANTVAAAISI